MKIVYENTEMIVADNSADDRFIEYMLLLFGEENRHEKLLELLLLPIVISTNKTCQGLDLSW